MSRYTREIHTHPARSSRTRAVIWHCASCRWRWEGYEIDGEREECPECESDANSSVERERREEVA